jgi:hypothetical protein
MRFPISWAASFSVCGHAQRNLPVDVDQWRFFLPKISVCDIYGRTAEAVAAGSSQGREIAQTKTPASLCRGSAFRNFA